MGDVYGCQKIYEIMVRDVWGMYMGSKDVGAHWFVEGYVRCVDFRV